MKTYTYFFYSIETGLTKIGRTKFPQQRFKALGGRKQLVVIHLIGADVEHDKHVEYAEYRKNGEWFRLPNTVLRSLKLSNPFPKMPDVDQERKYRILDGATITFSKQESKIIAKRAAKAGMTIEEWLEFTQKTQIYRNAEEVLNLEPAA